MSSHSYRNLSELTRSALNHWFNAWIAAIGIFLAQASLGINCANAQLCEGDAIWEISTRHLPVCGQLSCDPDFRISRLSEGCWQSSNLEALLSDTHVTGWRTIIYVHGNWSSASDARQRVMEVYRRAQHATNQPIRILLISWPSEQDGLPRKDVQNKKPIIDATSFYLGTLLDKLPKEKPLAFLGYSFGGAIICGALHLAGGGSVEGRTLCHLPEPPLCVRVGLAGPAFDQEALGLNGKYNRALDSISLLVNLYNSRDPALRRFRFFDLQSRPTAAGYAGLRNTRARRPLDSNLKIEQYDCQAIGRTHDELEYFSCPAFQKVLKNILDE